MSPSSTPSARGRRRGRARAEVDLQRGARRPSRSHARRGVVAATSASRRGRARSNSSAAGGAVEPRVVVGLEPGVVDGVELVERERLALEFDAELVAPGAVPPLDRPLASGSFGPVRRRSIPRSAQIEPSESARYGARHARPRRWLFRQVDRDRRPAPPEVTGEEDRQDPPDHPARGARAAEEQDLDPGRLARRLPGEHPRSTLVDVDRRVTAARAARRPHAARRPKGQELGGDVDDPRVDEGPALLLARVGPVEVERRRPPQRPSHPRPSAIPPQIVQMGPRPPRRRRISPSWASRSTVSPSFARILTRRRCAGGGRRADIEAAGDGGEGRQHRADALRMTMRDTLVELFAELGLSA